MTKKDFLIQKQNSPRQITVAEMAPHVHVFLPNENKLKKISAWLISWIESSLDNGNIKEGDFLPTKAELAFHTGVSIGTVQNVYRIVEDIGLIKSKQRVGTWICTCQSNSTYTKSISKRDCIIENLKKYILENNLQSKEKLPSIRKLAKELNISNATLKLAIENLVLSNILIKNGKNYFISENKFVYKEIDKKTLVTQTTNQIKLKYFLNNEDTLQLPTNQEIAKELNVSVKTVNDAMKILAKSGDICIRRGSYGTIVLKDKQEKKTYHYVIIEQQIRHLICSDYQIGMRLPSIKELATLYNVSTKTIKKALDFLQDDGYITFMRGHNGGTFVMDIPQKGNDAYKWLAINPQFMNKQN